MYPSRIPEVYRLITNDGEFLINSPPTFTQCAKYMSDKHKAGIAIKDILFRVIPARVPSAADILNSL